MSEVLKVTNLSKINEKNHLKLYDNILEGTNLKTKIEGSENIKTFLERLMASESYQSEL